MLKSTLAKWLMCKYKYRTALYHTHNCYSLKSVITARLFLNLSYTANSRNDSTLQGESIQGQPVFAMRSILSNIGAPLYTTNDDMDDNDGVNLNEIGVEDNVVTGESNRSATLQI